jgi:DNA polymerase IV
MSGPRTGRPVSNVGPGRWSRAIAHLDMDSFYASVEQRDHPELRGQPVIIGADPKAGRGRGVVSTASYEARRFGVRSAMPINQAYRLCPEGHFLPVRMSHYASVSRSVRGVLESFTPEVETISIDEAFLDLTASQALFGPPEAMIRLLQERSSTSPRSPATCTSRWA